MALKQPVSARNRFRFITGFYRPIFNAAACCPSRRDWRRWVDATRQQAGQDTMWPRLKYVQIPRYEGDGMSRVFPGEKLPPLDRMPGHVLHGWRDLGAGDRKKLAAGKSVAGWPHDESLADGHRWDTERVGASEFPDDWTDQQIVDAVRNVLEKPEWAESKVYSRAVWGEVGGVVIRVAYDSLPSGNVVFNRAYPDSISRKARKVV